MVNRGITQSFAGLTIRQAAAALDIAESTADADWAYAKSWLRLELADTADDPT
jgi:hypothetical protein